MRDVRIIEKGGDFGGTWSWNRYPGAQCDTASMVYMPLLEETGHRPTEKYAHAPEILAHCQRIGRQFGLYANALFHTEVEKSGLGRGELALADRDKSRRPISQQAHRLEDRTLHVPKLPGIPGIETFRGHSFHTSRWDYQYTGGGPDGGSWISSRTSASRSSAQAPRRSNACRIWRAPAANFTFPENAVLRGRASKRPDRSRLVFVDRDARLAAAMAGKFHRQFSRWLTRPKTWLRTAGPICRNGSVPR